MSHEVKPTRRVILIIAAVLMALLVACGGLGVVALNLDTANGPVLARLATSTLTPTPAQLAQITATPQPVQPVVIQPSPEIVVVTATPTNTPPASPTPIPTFTSTPTLLPSPTNTPASVGKTIIIIVTPTSPATATPYPEPPINLQPWDGAIVAQGQETLLHWSWNGLLKDGEFFEVKLRPDGQSRSAYIAQERGTGHTFTGNVGAGRYQWTVQVVQGYFKNNSGHSDDWVFEAYRSPESAPYLIIVDERKSSDRDDDDDKNDIQGPSRPSEIAEVTSIRDD